VKAIPLILLGAVTGALAAAAIDLLPLGDAGGIELFDRCLGMRGVSRCTSFPGLIFGIGFAFLLVARRQLRLADAVAFVIAAALSNAVAVFVWTAIVDPVGSLLEGAVPALALFSLTGAVAGAVGGGLLGFCVLRLLGIGGWWRAAAGGAALGLLLPLLTSFRGGEFVFYILWQAGYAPALLTRTTSPPRQQQLR
jgi:hypothetical protein